MTIYGVEQTYYFGDFKFEIGFDSGNETGLDQRDVFVSSRDERGKWNDGQHVRTFYFEDVNDAHLRAFCKKFVADAEYRAQSLAGTTDWAIRNALFYRNIGLYGTPALEALGGVKQVWTYLKTNWKDIVALPEYGRIQALDSAFTPSYQVIDPEIQTAVERFNQVPGVKTRFS